MMNARAIPESLLDRLPAVRGSYEVDAPLASLTWFRVGGAGDVLYRPADVADLASFLRDVPRDIPLTVIGIGSNLLIRDGGVRGVVIRLGKAFGKITLAGERLTVGGGALDITVASVARDNGLGGLEFLRGIPGSIGGAVAMNAGAYGREIADIFESATILLPGGQHMILKREDMDFAYRRAHLPHGAIIIEAVLRGEPRDKTLIQAEMDRIVAEREESQPLRTRTGGSTFKNPDGHKAWQLIDQAGCRGLTRGGAQMSPKHCNFMLNLGDATAADLEDLGDEVRTRVLAKTGIRLEWEIRRIGERV